MKNLDAGVLLLHRLTLKLWVKPTKTKQCSKQTCLQIIVLLNIDVTNIWLQEHASDCSAT